MPGAVIGKYLNYGFAGGVSRSDDCIITNRIVNDQSDPIPFGAGVMLQEDNTWSAVTDATTAANFAGVAVREVRQSLDYLNQNDMSYYAKNTPCDVIERGSVTVVCQNGTPKAGGAVYLRITANAAFPDAVVGGFEAVADGANSIQLTNAKWKTGKIDANNVAELTLLTRVNP